MLRQLLLLLIFTIGLKSFAAPICAKAHQEVKISDQKLIYDAGRSLSVDDIRLVRGALEDYSAWLGEQKPVASVERIVVEERFPLASFSFGKSEISINPKLFYLAKKKTSGPFLITLAHEYTHAFLEKLLRAENKAYADLSRELDVRIANGTPLESHQTAMISGVHELVADLLPALAQKKPDLVFDLLSSVNLTSRKFNPETLTQIIEARRFAGNKFTEVRQWQKIMEEHSRLFQEWNEHLVFSFAREKIWKSVSLLRETRGTRTAQIYVKTLAARLVQEIVKGKLDNTQFISLQTVLNTVTEVIQQTNEKYGI